MKLAASGDRLLISLRVQANENKSWFGLGAEATVHVWGKPVLDRDRQMLRLDRHRARCRVGGGLRAPRRGRARRGAVSGKGAGGERGGRPAPLAASARRSIEAAIADFRKSADGVRVDAAVTALRLVGIEFDAKTLRVIAEADGTVRVAVTKLP